MSVKTLAEQVNDFADHMLAGMRALAEMERAITEQPRCPTCHGTGVIRGESYGRDLWVWYECPACRGRKRGEGVSE